MATKGPSNRYGRTNGSSKGKSIHIGFPWAKDFNKHTIKRHFSDHGRNSKIHNQIEYAAKAVYFANLVDRINNISFIDKKGTTYKYSKKTDEFAIITRDGYVITYFKPKDGYKYFLTVRRKKYGNKKF